MQTILNFNSNMKQVKNFPDYFITSEGEVISQRRGETKKLTPYKLGHYLAVRIINDSEYKQVKVHRLVAEAFLQKPEGMDVVNHLDGNKLNNNVSNLEWTNSLGNSRHYRAMVAQSKSLAQTQVVSFERMKFLTQAYDMLKGHPEVFTKVFAATADLR